MNQFLKHFLLATISLGTTAIVMASPQATDTQSKSPVKSDISNAKSQNIRDIDRVIAIVNTEIITQNELKERVNELSKQFTEAKRALPPAAEFEKLVLDRLVLERIQAQEATTRGMRVGDAELNAIITNIAAEKKVTVAQLKESVEKSGQSFTKYKEQLRREVLISRFREHEVDSKIKITDSEVDNFIAERARALAGSAQANNAQETLYLAQILIPVPEGSSAADIATAKEKAEKILSQAKSEKDFIVFANRLAKTDTTVRFQDLGARTTDRLPQLFVDAAAPLSAGQILPEVLKSAAGFHVLKLVDRKGSKSAKDSIIVTQTEVRHLLIKERPGQNEEDVVRRLNTFRDQVRTKVADFGALAKRYSEDANSAVNGGALGWVTPGQLMPEFEQAMSKLQIGEVSDPVHTEFGWHLVQVINRKQTELSANQQKEFARASLRQSKLDQAYQDWLHELRDAATVELRDPYNSPGK